MATPEASIIMATTSAMKAAPVAFPHSVSIKLDNKNHLIWKQQMITIICVHKLMHFLDGSKPIPTCFFTEQDQRKGIVNPDFLS